MNIVVDSGSTKADWALIEDNEIKVLHSTKGLNPYFHDSHFVKNELLQSDFTQKIPVSKITNVFFYGAGCPDDFYKNKMANSLKQVFTNANIYVEHDLLGAARALCGNEPGVVAILGTGSNSCLYDGQKIIDNVPALAHVLGDEGGGVYLGKLILQAYFYRELPEDLFKLFNQTYPEGGDAIIHRIYGEGQNVQIASFAKFVIENKSHDFIKTLIDTSFSDFFKRHISKYQNAKGLPVHFVGSVAEMLQNELKIITNRYGYQLGQIIRKPIFNLAKYHANA